MRVLANYPMQVHRLAIFIFVPDFEALIADEALWIGPWHDELRLRPQGAISIV
jgi:hypothetical protein